MMILSDSDIYPLFFIFLKSVSTMEIRKKLRYYIFAGTS